MHSGNSGGGKPPSKRPLSDRYTWHRADHFKIITGGADLNSEQFGVYHRLINLAYCRRGPLPNDDVWLARQCNEDIRKFRRIKRELVAKAKIAIDEEQGLVYDERTIRELVDSAVYSEKQSARASLQGKQQRRQRPRVVVDNVGPVSAEMADLARTVGHTVHDTVSDTVRDSYGLSPSSISNISNTCEKNTRAKESQSQKNHSSSPAGPGAKRAAQPPRGGGAPKHGLDFETWRADQLRRMGPTPEEGKDAELAEPPAPEPEPTTPADKRCRRTA